LKGTVEVLSVTIFILP